MVDQDNIPQGQGPKEIPKVKKQTIHVPQLKSFVFKRKWWQKKQTQEEMDAQVNTFMKEQAMAGNSPMPGKCFGNHRTGEIVYVIAYDGKVEI